MSQPWKRGSNVLEVAATPELGISHPPDLLCLHRLSLIVFCLSYRVVPQQEKGSLREALSNNDQPVDLRTVTLSFHTQRKAVIMGGERQRPRGGELQAGQGMPSTKIDLHYSQFSTNSLKEQGSVSFWWRAWIVLGGVLEKSCLFGNVSSEMTCLSIYWHVPSNLFLTPCFVVVGVPQTSAHWP